jgi:hypothetical protein
MSTRLQIALLVSLMTTAVAFGVGIVVVLMTPALSAHAFATVPAVVVASLVIAAPTAWLIAPTLRSRYQRVNSR